MRIAVECQSPLLQKSLELFLAKYLCSTKKCDIVVRDVECLNDKRCFYISSDEGADLIKPFSKSQLILALEKRYEKLYEKKITKKELNNDVMDFEILEKRIELLTKEYQENILRVVKAFYEK
jgi:Leucine-rich repeat (LRR) protein